MKTMLSILVAIVFVLIGCDQKGNVDSTKEKAAAEEEASTKVQNDNLAQKAAKMEEELKALHQFYGAIEGEYKGATNVEGETYNIKIVIARTLPPYRGNRVRELSEIETDINNLYLHVRIKQWHPADPANSVPCNVSQVEPDYAKGTMQVMSSECRNYYSLMLNDISLAPNLSSEERAMMVAQQVQQGLLGKVDNLTGSFQPSNSPEFYNFTVQRMK